MKIVAVIAEYNPFHNGHAYQLNQIKKERNADAILVIMSGDFVQRGTPAIVDKYQRAHMALENGADCVLELPVRYATSSAEFFAFGAVSILNGLGCVDELVFGAETDALEHFIQIADMINNPSKNFEEKLSSYCKEGLSFPVARQQTILDSNPELKNNEEIRNILSKPNNILALEYCKALRFLKSTIKPVIIKRTTDNYADDNLTGTFSSATSIRAMLTKELASSSGSICHNWFSTLNETMPESALTRLEKAISENRFVTENDISQVLHYKLLSESSLGFTKYLDVSEPLSKRFEKEAIHFTSFTDFCNLCKSKEFTYTRISRALLHIFLGITKDSLPEKPLQAGFYARPLLFNEKGREILSIAKKTSRIPIITKVASYEKIIKDFEYSTEQITQERFISQAISIFEIDLHSAHLYEMLLNEKTHQGIRNEFQRNTPESIYLRK